MEHYGEPSYYHVSYRMRAIRDAIMLNLGYIPIYFLALCIYKKPNVVWQYKTTILFAGVVQYLFTLPFTIFNTWIAIAVDQEVETTVFMCTFLRIGSSFFNFISFNSLTAISINRLLLIIFNVNCGLAWNVLFFIIASLPIMVDIVYMFFVSHTTDNVMCGPILFFYEFAPQMIWNGYIFGIPLIAVLLNSTTAGYLYYNKYSAGANASYSQQRKVNELFIAIALLVQSVIPALTMSSTGYRSMQQIYGTKSVAWLDELIEISGTLTTGLNMIASMICIRQCIILLGSMSSSEDYELKLTDIPSDLIRKIIKVGHDLIEIEEAREIEGMKFISPRWYTLSLEHITQRGRLPVIKWLCWSYDYFGSMILSMKMPTKYIKYFGLESWHISTDFRNRDDSIARWSSHVPSLVQNGKLQIRLNCIARIFDRCSHIASLELETRAKGEEEIADMYIKVMHNDMKTAMGDVVADEIVYTMRHHFNKNTSSSLLDFVRAQKAKRLVVSIYTIEYFRQISEAIETTSLYDDALSLVSDIELVFVHGHIDAKKFGRRNNRLLEMYNKMVNVVTSRTNNTFIIEHPMQDYAPTSFRVFVRSDLGAN